MIVRNNQPVEMMTPHKPGNDVSRYKYCLCTCHTCNTLHFLFLYVNTVSAFRRKTFFVRCYYMSVTCTIPFFCLWFILWFVM